MQWSAASQRALNQAGLRLTAEKTGRKARATCIYTHIPPPLAQQPNGGQNRLILEISRSRTMTHHIQ
jgi:hypothetical protein